MLRPNTKRAKNAIIRIKIGSRQNKRDKLKDTILAKYNLPALRFKTNESNEEIRLINKLNEIHEKDHMKYMMV